MILKTDPVNHPGQYLKRYTFAELVLFLALCSAVVLFSTLIVCLIAVAINVVGLLIAALLLGVFAEGVVVWGLCRMWLVGNWIDFPKSIYTHEDDAKQ